MGEENQPTQGINTTTKMLLNLFDSIASIYKTARTIGTVVIVGGSLSAALALFAATPLINAEAYEFVSLTVLSAVFIISGCLLFAFLANLDFKMFIASRAIDQQEYDKVAQAYKSLLDALNKRQKRGKEIRSFTNNAS